MKPGRRALGIAESYRGTDDGAASILAGVVVRADRTVDDLVFSSCTIGGSDATDAIVECWRRLARPDVQYVLLAGVALAWYNLVDLADLHESTERPVVAVTFEESDGLADAIDEAFEGDARDRRLDAYEALPDRRRVDVGDGDLFVRSVGIDDADADRVVAAYTHERRPSRSGWPPGPPAGPTRSGDPTRSDPFDPASLECGILADEWEPKSLVGTSSTAHVATRRR